MTGSLPLVSHHFQAKKLHESMEALRAEANKLISDVNDREQKTATELERFVVNSSVIKIVPVIIVILELRSYLFVCVLKII